MCIFTWHDIALNTQNDMGMSLTISGSLQKGTCLSVMLSWRFLLSLQSAQDKRVEDHDEWEAS